MIVYAIRHKPTGNFLPAIKGRGTSFTEPEEKGGPYGPKLFGRKRSAQNSLTGWLRGKYERTTTYDTWGVPDGDTLKVRPEESRKRDEMEIVTYELTEIQGESLARKRNRSNSNSDNVSGGGARRE